MLPAELTIRAPVGAPVYRGKFDAPHAERLLWRAGFGPRPGEAEALAKLGLDGAVHSLLNPGAEKLVGPEAARLEGPPARAGRRVGPRPLLVARPDGAHVAPARRAHDARLARLVRDLERTASATRG